MAPGVHVPVAAVVHQPLGGKVAFGFLPAAAGVVGNGHLPAREYGLGDAREVFGIGAARPHLYHLDALFHLVDVVLGRTQQGAQAGLQRLHLAGHQSRLDLLDQLLHGQKRIGFAAVEPQAGQLVLGAGGGARFEAVATLLPIPHDG